MSDAPVLLDVTGRIARITLNRPDNRNSMNAETLPAFQEAVAQVRKNDDLRCLIITGTGESFCAGADFRSWDTPRGRLANRTLMDVYGPFLELREIECPVIAAMNGHAIGGGFGLALICDIRIANKNSKYGANFARLGIHSGMAISYLLPHVVGLPRANELLYTGRLIDGAEAARIGLANHVCEGESVLKKAMEIAEEIASCAPAAVRMIKQSVYRGLNWDPVKAAEWEAHCQSRTMEMDDAREGVSALLEKRTPDFKGR